MMPNDTDPSLEKPHAFDANEPSTLCTYPGTSESFFSCDERRDASTGSRPLLRLGLYLNGGALPATSSSTSTHRLSQCVDRTSRRERKREEWKRMYIGEKNALREIPNWRRKKSPLSRSENIFEIQNMLAWNIQAIFKKEILFEKKRVLSFKIL